MRALLLLSLLLSLCHSVRIVSGSITMTSKTGDIEQEYRMDINSTIKNVFVLNQSSKVYVDAKVSLH